MNKNRVQRYGFTQIKLFFRSYFPLSAVAFCSFFTKELQQMPQMRSIQRLKRNIKAELIRAKLIYGVLAKSQLKSHSLYLLKKQKNGKVTYKIVGFR